MNVDISFVIALWNQEKYIEQAVTSAFQNKCNVEVVVIDDGSTDSSWEVLQKLTSPSNISFKFLQQEHKGNMGYTVDQLYKNCTGKYVVELGSDDFLLPGALDVLLEAMEQNPNIGLAYSGYYPMTNDVVGISVPNPNNKYYQWINNPELRLLENNFVTPPCAFRRSLYDKVQYDPTQEINEDYLFKLELSRITNFLQIKKPLGVLRIRSDSISNDPTKKDRMTFWENKAREKVLQKYGR